MRILKKIIKKLYHLIWFLGAFLLFSPYVNAVGGTSETNGVEFVTAPYARMYDNTNERLTEITVNYNSTGRYYYGDLYYNGADTAGANLNFTLLTPVQDGYTYVLSILVGGNVSFKVSTKRVCIAENASNAVTRWHNNWCVTPSYTEATGTSQFYVANSSYPNTIGYSILYYIFRSNVTGRSINIAFNSGNGSASTTTVFGGYNLELLSDNSGLTQSQVQSAIQNSGLASANSVSQVQQGINQVKQEIQGMEQQQQQTNDKLDDVNDNLTDETAPNLDLSDLEVSSDTPISDLITMPLTILNSLSQALDGTCSNYTIPFLFNSSVTFPCFTISDYLGNTVTNYIDLFICFYMCYNIAMLVVSVFEDITSLRDIYDSLYVPKHADTGYQPRHAKGGGN